jgi:enoyl-CoA hydratase/carnithine racemase
MSSAPLLLDKHDRTAWITLHRPEALNAINLEMRDALWTALHAVRDDPDILLCVFRGAGDRAFSAGADITEFGTAPSFVEARRARHERDLWGLMHECPKPLVASVHGFAYGAGCELSLLCDIRIASEDATFALPEVSLGYIPSAGGTQTLPRTIRAPIAREMIYSGHPMDAARALALGLVHRVVARDRLMEETALVASVLAGMPVAALRAAKEGMRRAAELPLAQALAAEQAIASRGNAPHD